MWLELSNKSILLRIGKRIREERINCNLKQSEVAENGGLSLTTVIRAEKGEPINTENLIRILRVLDKLENLELLFPPQPISPILMKKLKGKKRLRVKDSKFK